MDKEKGGEISKLEVRENSKMYADRYHQRKCSALQVTRMHGKGKGREKEKRARCK